MTTGGRTVTLPDMAAMLERFGQSAILAGRSALMATVLLGAGRATKAHMDRTATGPANRPPGPLKVRTGTLRRSVLASPFASAESQTSIEAGFGSNLVYARFHEEGYHGRQQVKAHIRRFVAARTNMRGKLQRKSKARLLAWRSLHPGRGNYMHVRAHSRSVDYDGRPFVEPGMRDAFVHTPTMLLDSLAVLFQTGRVPSARSLMEGRGE